MTDREKLVELLDRNFDEQYEKNLVISARSTAKFLIANGVTFADRLEEKQATSDCKTSDWISVEERLPYPNKDVLVFRPNMAMQILVDSYEAYYGEDEEWHEGWCRYGKDGYGNNLITHWMPLPEPPKEE